VQSNQDFDPAAKENFQAYLHRYRQGVWRDRIFFDLIVNDARPEGRNLTILDVGCGHGFDGDRPLQEAMGRLAGTFIGIEPDSEVKPEACFHQVHACSLEDAPLPADSVDVAYAIMVLEHLAEPQRFWDKVYQVLKPGGVFWALTIDRRHWFCFYSRWFDRLKIKNWYLNAILGQRGTARYENYPVYYRSNAPEDVAQHARTFAHHACFSLSREGQCDGYFPRILVPLARRFDRRAVSRNRPGTLLVIRAEK
jgi:SAM-dependent methyltransferase